MKEILSRNGKEHGFLTSDKIFKTPFLYGFGFTVELECRHVITFADTTKEEKEKKQIFCPICKKHHEVLQWKRHFIRG